MTTTYIFFCGTAAIICVALFILREFGIFNISKRMELKNPWICFIPVADTYALGRIAEKYQRADQKKPTNFKMLLPIMNTIGYVLAVIFISLLFSAISSVLDSAKLAIEADKEMTMADFKVLIPVFIVYLFALTSFIVFKVLYFISLWRVYAIFNKAMATRYIILSVLFSFLIPFFLFALRNDDYVKEMDFKTSKTKI